MVKTWELCLNSYDYSANLNEFAYNGKYEGYFNTVIEGGNIAQFEDKFRKSIYNGQIDDYVVAGEVCFWKLFSYVNGERNRDFHAEKLLNHLSIGRNFEYFSKSLKTLANNPYLDNFKKFRQSCRQPFGFAVPLTFLSFYHPSKYPMIDAKIAAWWSDNTSQFGVSNSSHFITSYPNGPIDVQNDQNLSLNWNAYLNWVDFCQKYASLLTKLTTRSWTARNVEMAVFYAQENNIQLNQLDSGSQSISNNTPTNQNPKRGDFAGYCPKCNSPMKWREAQITGELYRGCTNYDGGCRYQERSY